MGPLTQVIPLRFLIPMEFPQSPAFSHFPVVPQFAQHYRQSKMQALQSRMSTVRVNALFKGGATKTRKVSGTERTGGVGYQGAENVEQTALALCAPLTCMNKRQDTEVIC